MREINGQEAGKENLISFQEWVDRQGDADFRAISRAGKLSRAEIVKACGFARSVLQQNPAVAAALKVLESDLRERGVLPPLAIHLPGEAGVDEPEPLRFQGQLAGGGMSARLKALEAQVDVLRAENTSLKSRLKKFDLLESVLGRTGRLPR